MTSLLDIAPPVGKVAIGDVEIECHGITAAGVVHLIGRFPRLRELLFPTGASKPANELSDPLALIHAAPETIAAILAAGTGHPGDPKHEKAAAQLPIEAQFDLLTEILRLTLPGGFVPFVERITSLFGGDADDRSASGSRGEPLPNGILPDVRELGTSSPSPSSG